jgi:hypothetical protein
MAFVSIILLYVSCQNKVTTTGELPRPTPSAMLFATIIQPQDSLGHGSPNCELNKRKLDTVGLTGEGDWFGNED